MQQSLSSDLYLQAPFWKSRAASLSHPIAIRMLEDLDPAGPMGIGDANNAFRNGFKHSYGQKDSNIDFLLRIKNKHPKKLLSFKLVNFMKVGVLIPYF